MTDAAILPLDWNGPEDVEAKSLKREDKKKKKRQKDKGHLKMA